MSFWVFLPWFKNFHQVKTLCVLDSEFKMKKILSRYIFLRERRRERDFDDMIPELEWKNCKKMNYRFNLWPIH